MALGTSGGVGELASDRGLPRDLGERRLSRDAVERMVRVGSWWWDFDTDAMTWSPELFRVFGFEPADVPPPRVEVAARIDPSDLVAGIEACDHARRPGGSFAVDQAVVLPDGSRRLTVVRGEAITDRTGAVAGLVGTTQDVTEHREAEHRLREREQHLEQLALRDPVTGLANRAAFTDELHRVLETARRWNATVGLVMVDLDGFKEVNDSLGHPAGDEVLRQVALRITRAVRAGDFVARMGGDEFMVLTGEVSDPSESARVARRLVDVMRAPFEIDGTEVTQTVSAGIALAEPGAEPEKLLREADAALYVAKSHGRDRSEFFDDRLRARTSARLALEDGLRHAIARGELSVEYQPEVDLVDGSVVAVEALLRWQRGDDRVEAGEFIAVAEDTGLITELGAWAIREACVHASRWKVQAPDGRLLTVRVNVSPLQLRDPHLPKIVSSALTDSGLTPSRLCLELTETAGLQDTETVRENLRLLSQKGVKFAVDDFGTGEASLFALTRVPVDVLKLDRDFVLALSDEGHSDVVAGVVAFATRLGVDVSAEGVENGDQATLLRRLGCRTGQGFLWAAAMPPDQIDGILGGPNPAWVS
jgi:diguanylate cyclase (GGDEF)-like protein